MMKTTDDFLWLNERLSEFIRKFYQHRLRLGLLVFSGAALAIWLLISYLEYAGRFDTQVRTVLFIVLMGSLSVLGTFYVLIPLYRLWNRQKLMSPIQASRILGRHFPEIEDRLLNTLQLHQDAIHVEDKTWIEASIKQKISQLRPVPFLKAINTSKLKSYLRWVMIPVGLWLITFLWNPDVITGSGERLLNFKTHYATPAPFHFILLNKSLKIRDQEEIEILMKTEGKVAPEEMFIQLGNESFRMEKRTEGRFAWKIRNAGKSIDFHFHTAEFSSNAWTLEVIPVPRIGSFELTLDFPAYLGRKREVMQNSGDMSIPEGTKVSWKMAAKNTDEILLQFSDGSLSQAVRNDDWFTAQALLKKTVSYRLLPKNKHGGIKDTMAYQISVIPDAYPQINVDNTADSLSPEIMYFSGSIADDYGLSALKFIYQISRKNGNKEKEMSIPVQIRPGELRQSFYQYFNARDLPLQPGDQVDYYFEVLDNDGVNGAKRVRSNGFAYRAPTLEEVKKEKEKSSESIQKKMENALKEASRLQQDMKKLEEKMANQKSMGFEEKKQVEDMLKKQENLRQEIENLQKEYKAAQEKSKELSKEDQELMEKQDELQKLMDQMLNQELKEMMKEMQELLKQQDKDKVKDQLKEMQAQDKEVQKELDRMLELFKKMELAEKQEEAVKKLDELEKRQEELAKESENKSTSAEEIKKKQEALNKEFNDLKKDLDKMEKENEKLEEPMKMEDTKQDQEDISNDQNQSTESLKQNNKKQAAAKQKEAANKMKEMKKKMEKNMEQEEKEKQEEDYNSLRQIMENLVDLSFAQEKLMDELKTVRGYSPQYVVIGQKQKKLKDDARLIEDSLLALSKRVAAIQNIINREIGKVNLGMDKTIQDLAARHTGDALVHQQNVMTHVNNLAVLLSDVLQQMQNNMKENQNQNAKGSGQGKKKKKGKGGSKGQDLQSLRKMQEELSKQLQQMREGQQPGNQGKPGSKEFAQAAAKQAAIRQKLRQLANEYGKEGGTQMKNQLEQLQRMMEQQEKELYNKKLTLESIRRQQDITSRLLESEKAEMERETEQTRQATQGKDLPPASKQRFEEYKKKKSGENETLRSVPPSLTPYYRQKVKEYFQQGNP